MIEVSAITCPNCGDIIFSRTRHDHHSCSCGSVSIDGGFDYMRIHFTQEVNPEHIKHLTLELDITKQDLFNDWNSSTDKYGVIRREQ